MTLAGLYAITDARYKGDSLAHQVEQAILGGARVIQYRDKSNDAVLRLREASEILAVCRVHQVPLLINDDIQLADEVGADGVHIGQDDADYFQARQLLGDQAIIGVSCYNQLALAQQAEQQGADYVAFGRFFPSGSKPLAVQADIALLQQARRELACPIVAIGGIHAENGAALVDAGADMLAVIQSVFAAQDVKQAARQMSGLFDAKGC